MSTYNVVVNPSRLEQMSGVYDVTAYGATGDGSTDDTGFIDAAIAACEAASGGIVYFPFTDSGYSNSGIAAVSEANTILAGPSIPVDIVGGGPRDLFGLGTPEAIITAPIGSTYRRAADGANNSFYVKETGTGNTGWVGK